MTKQQDLLHHAERCRGLAENCRNQAVAAKLRELSDYYLDLAGISEAYDSEATTGGTRTRLRNRLASSWAS
jgi:hypothetical protein